MSERFFQMTIACPHCNHKSTVADGYETDDWVEVFVFSGYTEKSANYNYSPDYTCPSCSSKLNRDSLFTNKLISVESIDKVKAYLSRMLDYVIERGGIYDHGWKPDLDAVLSRYSSLYPEDRELLKLKDDYCAALYNKRAFTKFEPLFGTYSVGSENIRRPHMLEKVYLPNGLKQILPATFRGCIKLRDLFVPDSVEDIGVGAFEGSGLVKIHLSSNIARINDTVFKGCRYLTKVFLSDSIEVIGSGAFEGCASLLTPWIPSKLKRIEKRAFYGCSSIEELWIPEHVEYIGEDAFTDCPKLTVKCAVDSAAHIYAKAHGIKHSVQ